MTIQSIRVGGFKPAAPLNMNDGSETPAQRRKLKAKRDAWRKMGWALGNQQHPKPAIVGQATVRLIFGTDRPNQRRDPHNFVPTLKYLIDGLTLARWWSDDDALHVRTVEPEFDSLLHPDRFEIVVSWEVPDADPLG